MPKLNITASIDIVYRTGRGVTAADLKRQLEWAISHLAGEGLLSGELDATVDTYNVRIPGEIIYAVGDPVSMAEWDKYAGPRAKMGQCRVTAIANGQRCESGVMVEVESAEGVRRAVDSHWLRPVEKE